MRDAATGRLYEVDDDELEEIRKNGIRDGDRLRVPVMVADAAGRERPNWMAADGGASLVEDEACYVTDALGRPAGRRPGYMFAATDVAQRRVDDAYAARDAWLQNAWRHPGGERAGDASANSAGATAGNAQDALDRAYEERDKLLTNSWRGNKALPPGASANAVEDPDEERRRAFNPEALPRVVTAHVAAPARGNNSNADEDVYAAHKRALSNAWRTR